VTAADGSSYVEVIVGGARYGLPIEDVLEVLPRVWTTPLVGVVRDVDGVFLHRGTPTVAVDARPRFGHEAQRRPDDHFVVLRSPSPQIAMIVDEVVGTRVLSTGSMHPPPVPHERIRGAAVTADGLVLLAAPQELLAPVERGALEHALEG
jgi:chemotaxis signal transduction protein